MGCEITTCSFVTALLTSHTHHVPDKLKELFLFVTAPLSKTRCDSSGLNLFLVSLSQVTLKQVQSNLVSVTTHKQRCNRSRTTLFLMLQIELRNIIDKLAQFVARNGPEFEQMTKNKQKGNPKFSFLFGGEHFNYYQYKVTTEQAILKQKATRDTQVGAVLAAGMPPHMLNNTAGSAASTPLTLAAAAQWLALPSLTLDTLTTQQGQLQDQIRQSEQNLAAQHTVLMQQQQTQIEDALRKSQEDALQRASEEAGVSINEFDSVLQPIVDSCTKDSISSGKGWILQRSTSPKADEVIALHLLRKVIAQGCPFNQKLHIIYLVNDVLHHCARKNAEDLKKALENVVVPMFCNSSIGITEEQQLKLNKLLNLWESKNNYFDTAIVAKLKNPSRSWSEYQAGLITQHAAAITPITTSTKQTYEGYQAQHQAFIQHALQQIQLVTTYITTINYLNSLLPPTCPIPNSAPFGKTIEQQKQTLEQQQAAIAVVAASSASLEPTGHMLAASQPPQQPALPQAPPPHQNNDLIPPGIPPHVAHHNSPGLPPPSDINFSQPPPGYIPVTPSYPPELPDLSKPPPGFPAPPQIISEVVSDELMPSVPYFELPAGLMVPLIKLEDSEYRSLDPDSIRLPPPAPPSERLLAAVEAFYAPPCHDRPRDRRILDSEGWEKLGLYEYYRAKNAARRKKEEDIDT
uniref:Calcium homeostasis endoplasmic reticulum protein n=1 Tax=Timema genevievae TaxID=629358 RepID=A0A7R9K3Q7_TIMGE|nr:unnamed protein product [Timema genevievae]